MLRQKRKGKVPAQWALLILAILITIGILAINDWTAKNRQEWLTEMAREKLLSGQNQIPEPEPKELELAPYQTELFQGVIFSSHIYTPLGDQSLLILVDAVRYGILWHLDDINGFLEGEYAHLGNAMPYDVGKVQQILHDQGVESIYPGDGALIHPFEALMGSKEGS